MSRTDQRLADAAHDRALLLRAARLIENRLHGLELVVAALLDSLRYRRLDETELHESRKAAEETLLEFINATLAEIPSDEILEDDCNDADAELAAGSREII